MKNPTYWIAALVVVILVAGSGYLAGRNILPIGALTRYPADMLLTEAQTMAECAECHATSTFHTCETCHDDHGAVELEGVGFYAGIVLLGDVPSPGYVLLHDILPNRDLPHTHLPLRDFLAARGAEDFESVTLMSNDGGFVTVDRKNLTADALLMPYVDGIRFAAEDLHISTWIKGITRIVVVSQATPLRVNEQATSMGRLLVGPMQTVTVEQTNVMLKSAEDGEIRTGQTASRIEGVLLAAWLPAGFAEVVVETADGARVTLAADEVEGALLAQLRGRVTLVLPGRARSAWIGDVISLETR